MLYVPTNARSEEQATEMRRLEKQKICVFCPEGLVAVGQEIVHRTDHWTVTPNRFPYPDTRRHLLLVPYSHVSDVLELSVVAKADYYAAVRWAVMEYALSSYKIIARNGDPRKTGASIVHLHVHLVEPR